MNEPSTSTAKDPKAVESAEPSLKKKRLSTEPLTLEEEFNALRAEYDERRLDEIVEEKKLTEAQRGLLRKPIHKHMVRSEVFFGNKHGVLADLVNDVGFGQDKQDRRIVGIVQPFGAGKTKTALMLSHGSISEEKPEGVAFVVLPIRCTEQHVLLNELEKEQRKLFKAINKEVVSAEDVQDFSNRCQRLLKLAVLSVAAVFRKCASESWFDPHSAKHRLQFGLLAISEGSAVISEMVKWFAKHVDDTNDVDDFNDLRKDVLNEVTTQSGLRLVFVIDEIQQLRKRCRGYCMHRSIDIDEMDEKEELEFINSWKRERKYRPAEGHTTCTDLFYQMCCLMADWLGVEGAFVVCSTMFKTWTKMEDMGRPQNRETLRRFTDTHWLSAANCKELIQHYFDVTDQQLAALDLELLTRPVFACDFILQLHSHLGMPNSTPLDITGWLKQSYDKTVANAEDRLINAAKNALKKENTRKLMARLVTHIRLTAGLLDKAMKNDPEKKTCWNDEVELVNAGLLKLEPTTDNPHLVEIADPLAERAILKSFATSLVVSERSAVLETLASDLKIVSRQNKTQKGFVFEQALAYLALKGLIRVPKYLVSDGTVAYEYLKSTAEFATLFDELPMKSDSATLANEATLVGDLLLARQSPELNYILLPTTLCGPDILFRGSKMIDDERVGAVNVVIQSKVEDRVFGYADFLLALTTLNPAEMFGSAAKEVRSAWQERLGALHEVEFMRVVFAALGFNEKVQHVVHEYNLRQSRNTKPSFIQLLNLDDLRESLEPTLYSKIKARLPSREVAPNLVAKKKMPSYESAWMKANKGGMNNVALVELCKAWDIVHSNMNQAKLVKALDDHEQTLADCFQQLSLHLPVAVEAAQPTGNVPLAAQAAQSTSCGRGKR